MINWVTRQNRDSIKSVEVLTSLFMLDVDTCLFSCLCSHEGNVIGCQLLQWLNLFNSFTLKPPSPPSISIATVAVLPLLVVITCQVFCCCGCLQMSACGDRAIKLMCPKWIRCLTNIEPPPRNERCWVSEAAAGSVKIQSTGRSLCEL